MFSWFLKIIFSHENIFLVTEGSCKRDTFLNGQVLMQDETDTYYYFFIFLIHSDYKNIIYGWSGSWLITQG